MDRQQNKSISLSSFLGVDYSSSPMDVSNQRSISARNFINENGINVKRKGWRELKRFGLKGRVNGIWHFSTLDISGGLCVFSIVQSGTKFYSYNIKTNGATDITGDIMGITDKRSYAIAAAGKLYILCGDFLVFGQFSDSDGAWVLRRVFNNTDTHIPTTAIALSYEGKYQPNEKPNILSQRRINKLTYNGAITDSKNIFTLDSKRIDSGKIEITCGEQKFEYSVNNADTDIIEDTNIKIVPKTGIVTFKTSLAITKAPEKDNVFITFNYFPRDEKGELIENYEERITKCTIGTMFGLGGVDDRLFISGNPKFANICFHSNIIADKSLTYFPDDNTAACGNDGDPITAFSRLGDGTLAIHKGSGRNDANIYYRRGESVTSSGANGLILSEEIFPLTAGALGEGVLTSNASASLSGDNLILSENGVYGVVLGNNMVTNERYARERSRFINERLTKHNLADSCAAVYKNRYYLAVDNECYIADARYVYSAKGDMPGAYNYEWWHWDNIPARVWAVIDDKLYFGTDSGSICVFYDGFADLSYEYISSGLTIDLANNGFVTEQSLIDKFNNGDRLTITSNSGIYAEYINKIDLLEDSRLKPTSEKFVFLLEGKEVFVYGETTPALSLNNPYIIKNVLYGEPSFELFTVSGTKVSISQTSLPLKLCEKIKDKLVEVITNSSLRQDFMFKVGEIDEGDELNLIKPFAGVTEAIQLNLNRRKNVAAEWITPVMDLGSNAYSKNLKAIRISSEPTVGGKISFGFKTYGLEQLFSARGVNTFNFDSVDFNNFSFEINRFATSYTKNLLVRGFNYIMLKLLSDNDTSCAVNNISIDYTPVKKNKGVR